MLGGGGAVFRRCVHHTAVVGIKAQRTVLARASLQRVAADRAVGFDGAWRVLKLVINALRELCRRAHWFAQRLELPRVASALRRRVIRERGSHLTQGCDGARFCLRRGVALTL